MSDEPTARIEYVSGGRNTVRTLDVDRVRLGRSPDLEFVFSEDESGVSRHHATILREGAKWFIEDAGSRNGTFVNGKRIERSPLRSGDRIDLGPLLLTFRVEVRTSRPTVTGPILDGSLGSSGYPKVVFTGEESDSHLSTSINLKVAEESIAWRTDGAHIALDSVASDKSVRDRAWAITMFKEVGRALTVATDLDEMLETVMVIAFSNVPAQRGVICLVHENGELDPRVVRTDGGEAGGTLQFSRTIVNEAVTEQTALLVKDVGIDDRFNAAQSIAGREVRSAVCVPLYHEGRTAGVIYLDTASRRAPFTEQHLDLIVGLALFAAIAIAQFELREKAVEERLKREKLSQYHTPAVVDRILAGVAGDADMIASKEEVTVLFADIKGFTAMSETMPATSVVELLNTVFGRLVKSVFRNQGTLDKFMGDGMLAYFGAPLKLENHAHAAIRAAMEMQREMQRINEEGIVPRTIEIRIGINSGPAVVGDIGSPEQSNHTVIGDTVNVASRLESTVALPGQVVIGPDTFERIDPELCTVEKLPPVELKGKTLPIEPFRVVELATPLDRATGPMRTIEDA